MVPAYLPLLFCIQMLEYSREGLFLIQLVEMFWIFVHLWNRRGFDYHWHFFLPIVKVVSYWKSIYISANRSSSSFGPIPILFLLGLTFLGFLLFQFALTHIHSKPVIEFDAPDYFSRNIVDFRSVAFLIFMLRQ